jgi:hypothetical protein
MDGDNTSADDRLQSVFQYSEERLFACWLIAQ